MTTPVWFPISNLDMNKHLENSPPKISGAKNERNENRAIENYTSKEHFYGETLEDQTNRQYVYDLFAVCNHKGQNMANGHYTGKDYFF